MFSFKSYTHRWLAGTTLVAPYTTGLINAQLRKSAEAAAAQCTGGDNGRRCGFYWADAKYVEPGTSGAGEQMDVLAAVLSTLVDSSGAPAANSTGDGAGPGAGGGDSGGQGRKPSAAGRADAATSTLLLGLAVWAWMAL
jgi:mannan endo-1,6-alpha-mannosidase